MDGTPGTISFNVVGLNSRMLKVDMLKISRVTLSQFGSACGVLGFLSPVVIS